MSLCQILSIWCTEPLHVDPDRCWSLGFLALSLSCTLCCIRYGLTECCAKSDNESCRYFEMGRLLFLFFFRRGLRIIQKTYFGEYMIVRKEGVRVRG
jgi:hypothetical protein